MAKEPQTDNNDEVEEDETEDTEETQTEASKTTSSGRRTPQTAAGSGSGDGDFADPVTPLPGQFGRAVTENTRVDSEEDREVPKLFRDLTKALGFKTSDLLSYNERTRTVVYSNGAKYQLSRNGKSLRHLQGPQPPKKVKNLVDARTRGYVGAAAALNAPGDPVTEEQERQARIEALKSELASLEAE